MSRDERRVQELSMFFYLEVVPEQKIDGAVFPSLSP